MKERFKIVMLPIEKADNNTILLVPITRDNDRVWLKQNKDTSGYQPSLLKPQHLYIISDEKTRVDNWWYNTYNNYISNKDVCDYGVNKKIIASTDKSLVSYGVKLIPESFTQAYIKAYNEGKSITEVDLEMELSNLANDFIGNQFGDNIQKLKTRADNTVIIHQSKTYTRDEVIKIIYECDFSGLMTNDWIDKNL